MAQLMHHLVTRQVQRSPAALASLQQGSVVPYATFARRIDWTARGLVALGLRPGDRAGIWMEYREEALTALFAVAAAGAVAVPIDPCARTAQALGVLEASGARALLATPNRLRALEACGVPSGRLRALVSTDSWECDLSGAAELPAVEPDWPAVQLADGSVHSHRTLCTASARAAVNLGLQRGDRLLSVMPLCSEAGLLQLLAGVAAGAASVLYNRVGARDIVSMAEQSRATVFAADSATLNQLSRLHWPGCPALRLLLCPPEPLAEGSLDALCAQLPGVRLSVPPPLEPAAPDCSEVAA